jgi:hypothetical protein
VNSKAARGVLHKERHATRDDVAIKVGRTLLLQEPRIAIQQPLTRERRSGGLDIFIATSGAAAKSRPLAALRGRSLSLLTKISSMVSEGDNLSPTTSTVTTSAIYSMPHLLLWWYESSERTPHKEAAEFLLSAPWMGCEEHW